MLEIYISSISGSDVSSSNAELEATPRVVVQTIYQDTNGPVGSGRCYAKVSDRDLSV